MAARAKFTHAINRLKAVGSLTPEQFSELKTLQKAKDDRVTVSLYAALSAKDGAGDELTRLRAAIEETFGWALPVSEGKEDEELVISRGMGARKDAVEEEEREAGRRKDRATEDPRDRKRTTVPVALPE